MLQPIFDQAFSTNMEAPPFVPFKGIRVPFQREHPPPSLAHTTRIEDWSRGEEASGQGRHQLDKLAVPLPGGGTEPAGPASDPRVGAEAEKAGG